MSEALLKATGLPNTITTVATSGNTPTDTTISGRAVWVGVSGDLTLTVNGTDTTFPAIPAGQWVGIATKFTAVKASGSTATHVLVGQ